MTCARTFTAAFLAFSISTQTPQTRKPSKVFYMLGSIMLAIWLLNIVFNQNAPRSSTSRGENKQQSADTTTVQQSVDQAAKRAEEWGKQSEITANAGASSRYSAYSATPNYSPAIVRRALPVETPATTREFMPSTTPPVRSYRVVNVAARDFLYLRAGPGSTYPAVARLPASARGITLGENRTANGSTIWQEISVAGYTGWVNEIYLQAEKSPR
jgi:Bacterial SH3 domain